jgi:hypothetical protein
MKKLFGILLLILSMFLVNVGTGILSYNDGRQNSIDGYVRTELSESYRNDQEGAKIGGAILLVIGLSLFVTGIVLTATKTKAQRIMEAELELYRLNNATVPPLEKNKTDITAVDTDSIDHLKRLSDLKSKNIISEEEFTEQKKRILHQSSY